MHSVQQSEKNFCNRMNWVVHIVGREMPMSRILSKEEGLGFYESGNGDNSGGCFVSNGVDKGK